MKNNATRRRRLAATPIMLHAASVLDTSPGVAHGLYLLRAKNGEQDVLCNLSTLVQCARKARLPLGRYVLLACRALGHKKCTLHALTRPSVRALVQTQREMLNDCNTAYAYGTPHSFTMSLQTIRSVLDSRFSDEVLLVYLVAMRNVIDPGVLYHLPYFQREWDKLDMPVGRVLAAIYSRHFIDWVEHERKQEALCKWWGHVELVLRKGAAR